MGKNWRLRGLIWVLIAAVAMLGVPLFPASSVQAAEYATAKLCNIKGGVYVKKSGGGQAFQGFDGMTLTQGDWIRTDSDGYAEISYENGTETTLDINTEVFLERLTSDGESSQTTVKLNSGGIWNKVKSFLNMDDEYEVETPTSVLGVRGTLYYVSQDNQTGTSSCLVMEGQVNGLENNNGGIGREQRLFTGQALEFRDSPGQPAQIKKVDPNGFIPKFQVRILSKILIDINDRLKELLDSASKAKSVYANEQNPDALRLACLLADQARELSLYAVEFIECFKGSERAELVDKILREHNLNLDRLKLDFEKGQNQAERTWSEIDDLLKKGELSRGEVNAVLNRGFDATLYGEIVRGIAKVSPSNGSNASHGGNENDDDGPDLPSGDSQMPDEELSFVSSVDNGNGTATITVEVKKSGGEVLSNLTAVDFIVKFNGQSFVVADTPSLFEFFNKGSGLYKVLYSPGIEVEDVVEIVIKGVSITRDLCIVISDPGELEPNDPETQTVFVDGGEEHSLALTSDGVVLAWGTNLYGQLGNAETPRSLNKTLPVPVSDLSNVVSLAAGSYHSLALKANGTVWGWGRNECGELGSASYYQVTPTQLSELTNVVAISAGAFFSLALKNDGTVWAWGYNNYGQLGNGTRISSSIPIQVSNLTNIKAIAAGDDHALAVDEDGTVWGWGNNSHGQTGNGNLELKKVFEPVQVNGLSEVKAVAVAAGYAHSLALMEDGTVWGWGANYIGQLGRWDDYTDRAVPSQVSGLSEITCIAAGWEWSLAIKDGQVFAWGDNNWGQLGDGTREQRTNIVQVNNLTNVKGISAGKEHSMAMLNDNTVKTWGRNNKGQLGVGADVEESYVPIAIEDGTVSDPEKSASKPNMAYDSDNDRYLLVYENVGSDPSATADIYGRFVNLNGTAAGTEFKISDGQGAESTPRVAYNSAIQQYLVVWSSRALEYSPGGSDQVKGRLVDATGQVNQSVLTLNDRDYSIFKLAVAAGDTNFIVVWGQNNGIQGRLIDEDGIAGDIETITGISCNFPAVAYGNGKFLVTYQESSADNYDIKANILNIDGTQAGGVHIIAAGSFQQKNPQVVYGNDNNFLVVWEDEDENGRYHISSRIVDGDGAPLSDVIKITNNAANQTMPVVSANSSNNFLVVWQDEQNGNKDIYAQVVAYDGTDWLREGDNFGVIVEDGDQGNPTVSYHAGIHKFLIGYENGGVPQVIDFSSILDADSGGY